MKVRGLAVVAACLLALSSCDTFFSTNLFKEMGLGQVSADSLKSMSSSELVSLGAGASASSSFYDVLTKDAGAKADVLATLAATYGGSGDPAAAQGAAALAAKVELVTTGADGLVNNVVSVVTSGTDFTALTPADAVSAIKDLVPEGLRGSQASFTAAINAILDSKTALDAMGTSVGSDGIAQIDKATVGTAAQSALVATFLDALDFSSVDQSPGVPFADAPSLLWAMLQPSPPDTSTLVIGTIDTGPGNPLGNLLFAAGIDLTALGG